MRFLVTGAAGFIGSHVCDRLLSDGHRILAVDCLTDYYDRERKLANLAAASGAAGFELVPADLLSADLDELLSGVEGVFHLAAQPGVRGSWTDFDTYLQRNVVATQRLMESVGRRPVPIPVVFASSSSVYGDAARVPVGEDDPAYPVSPYGVTKLASEHIARLYGKADGAPVVALRYFTVYGPRQRPDMAFSRFIDAAIAGRPLPLLGDGGQSRDFTFVADAVDATVRAMGATPGSYNVGGGSRASINEVIALLEDIAGRPLASERGPAARGDARHTWANTTRCREALGWKPTTPLAPGLTAQYEWTLSAHAAA